MCCQMLLSETFLRCWSGRGGIWNVQDSARKRLVLFIYFLISVYLAVLCLHCSLQDLKLQHVGPGSLTTD